MAVTLKKRTRAPNDETESRVCESQGTKILRMRSLGMVRLSAVEVGDLVEKAIPGQGYRDIFIDNEIDGNDLLQIEKTDLRAIGVKKLNHINKILDLRTKKPSKITSQRVEYKGFSKDGNRFVRIPLWNLTAESEEEKNLKFYLQWEPIGDFAPEFKNGKMLQCGRSGPLKMYDLFRDVASDGKYNYILEQNFRHPRQKETEIERLALMMESTGIKVIPKRPVFVRLDMEVTEINLVKESFSIACELNCWWQDPDIFSEKRAVPIIEEDEDMKQYVELPVALTRKGEDERPFQFNKLFKLAIGRSLVLSHREESYNPRTTVIHGKYKLSVQIEETMELQRFPFDRQLLHVFLKLDCGDWTFLKKPPKRWLVPPNYATSRCSVKLSSSVASEYKSFPPVVEYDPDLGGISFVGRVQRYQNFYFLNIILPAFIITMIGATGFLFERDSDRNLESRVTLTIRLILTIVAFKLWVSSVLPVISYTTVLDMYILAPYLLMAFVASEAVAIFFLVEANRLTSAKNLDRVCAIVYVVFWGGINVIYVVLMLSGLAYKPWDQVERENFFDTQILSLEEEESATTELKEESIVGSIDNNCSIPLR